MYLWYNQRSFLFVENRYSRPWTCCNQPHLVGMFSLDNMILEVDDLKENWVCGQLIEWEGELGQHSNSRSHAFIPSKMLERMHDDGLEPNLFDTSGMGRGTNRGNKDMDSKTPLDFGGLIPDVNNNSVYVVNKLNCDFLRQACQTLLHQVATQQSLLAVCQQIITRIKNSH